ncbi:hypothetical protein S40285_10165 [Stachybotrys chlorohalonatus IBT 40285]|uniref:N-acetyltransferase domain-containing protein n=1 Tax=Stachybotrys chlorohalonatus (strain IBT 40285) TaxID=1283841 RepID=A0A084R0C8_STAC4|nr:hypothetical protein S40285_10165 [Stachybotrys chlorohalonata IBT 40285]
MIGAYVPFNPPPGFNVRDATLADVEDITRLWYASFNQAHKFYATATPDDEETRRWFSETWTIGILTDPGVLKTLVVEDLTKSKKLVAFSRIHMPQPDGSQHIPLPDMPAGWDPEITEALWGGMEKNRASIMGKRLHWMGEFMGVDQAYQTKGLACTMLDWICSQADITGLEIYFDATMEGLPLYKKRYGFKEVRPLNIPKRPETYGTFEVMAMVRAPKRHKVQSLL